MRKNILLATILSCLFLGCATTYNVEHRKHDSIENPFTTDRVVFFQEGYLYIEMAIIKITSRDSNYFQIEIDHTSLYGDDRIEGEITIQADDKIIKINDTTPSNSYVTHGYVKTSLNAVIIFDDLYKIANAKKVRIQYYGEPQTIDENGISIIKRFYEEFR